MHAAQSGGGAAGGLEVGGAHDAGERLDDHGPDLVQERLDALDLHVVEAVDDPHDFGPLEEQVECREVEVVAAGDFAERESGVEVVGENGGGCWGGRVGVSG